MEWSLFVRLMVQLIILTAFFFVASAMGVAIWRSIRKEQDDRKQWRR